MEYWPNFEVVCQGETHRVTNHTEKCLFFVGMYKKNSDYSPKIQIISEHKIRKIQQKNNCYITFSEIPHGHAYISYLSYIKRLDRLSDLDFPQ